MLCGIGSVLTKRKRKMKPDNFLGSAFTTFHQHSHTQVPCSDPSVTELKENRSWKILD